MSNGETLAQSGHPASVPQAGRLGNILGWGLPALGVACFIASLQIGITAGSAWHAAQALPGGSMPDYTAYKAAETAYREATLRVYPLAIVGSLSLCIVPGLLYAARPSLLGGPLGHLLRWASANVGPRRPARRHPITFYQGLGWALPGVGMIALFLANVLTTLTPGSSADLWLILVAGLLSIAAMLMSIPLIGGSWWFTDGRRDPATDVGNHRLEAARADE